jgi:hypothetical protein
VGDLTLFCNFALFATNGNSALTCLSFFCARGEDEINKATILVARAAVASP